MTLSTRTLRPGLLVSLSVRVVGNIDYAREVIEDDHLTEEGQRRARWETKRVIADPEEWERARETRYKCRSTISRLCVDTSFGLLCPESLRQELDDAVQESQRAAAQFNSSAARTKIRVYVIVGRIAQDDLQAVRSINSEVRSLLDAMTEGVKNLDAKAIRAAAYRAKSVGQMLSPGAADRIKSAVEAARDAAKRIVKAGEQAAQVVNQQALKRLAYSRTMFLDMDEVEVDVALPDQSGREVDLEPELPIAAQEDQRREIEL